MSSSTMFQSASAVSQGRTPGSQALWAQIMAYFFQLLDVKPIVLSVYLKLFIKLQYLLHGLDVQLSGQVLHILIVKFNFGPLGQCWRGWSALSGDSQAHQGVRSGQISFIAEQ